MNGHVWLVGMMGSGKSTIGTALAERTGARLVDTDSLIEQRHGHTIAELWAEHGEPWFRETERATVAELAADSEPMIVATGGGVILSPVSREAMRNSGLVVWLYADLATILGRVGTGEDRPLIGTNSPVAVMDRLMSSRFDRYAGVAHATVSTIGDSPDRALDEVEALWSAT